MKIKNVGNKINELETNLADMTTQKRNVSDKITSNDLDISTQANKIQPINISDALMTMFSPAGSVSPVIPLSSIGVDKLSYLPVIAIPSKNLFNKATVIANRYIYVPNGSLASDSTTFSVSDWIPILPSTNYCRTSNQVVGYYDSNKVFISYVSAKTFTTPSNCYYVRITVLSTLVDAEQVEIGSLNTSYENFGNKIDKNTIKIKTIEQSMLNFSPLVGEASKNLFDASAITVGKYVSFTNGVLETATGFNASDFIPITPSTQYARVFNKQIAFYDANKSYISGLTDGTKTFTTPANAYYVRLTVMNAQLATEQFELGSVSTSYQSPLPCLPFNRLSGFSGVSNKPQGYIIVAKNGGDYNTIMGAVNSVPIGQIVTILIMPGLYIESVDIANKNISLIGFNKRTCIIRNDSGDYYYPPVNMSCKNSYVANLTLLATHDGDGGVVPTLPSYAIHCDTVGEGVAEIYNCVLTSMQHAGIGIGLHNNQTLVLNSCEIYKNDIDRPVSGVGAIYGHNWQNSGATNQHLIVKNCLIETENGVAINFFDANNSYENGTDDDLRDTTVSFYNTILWSKTNGKPTVLAPYPSLGEGYITGYIKLTQDSFGNNAPFLNV